VGSNEKYQKLLAGLRSAGSLAVAFSGGVDSSFLLYAAREALSGNLIAVTARSLSYPKREIDAAAQLAQKLGVKHIFVDSEELEIEGFSQNPANRCYLCKSELFQKILAASARHGIACVAEGTNADDDGDYRPGLRAVKELGILSPLANAGFTKAEIRALSKEFGLPTWNRQNFACLASRFPYGETITPERLKMLDKAEQFLLNLGFNQLRVRFHGNLARIETDEAGFALFADKTLREQVHGYLRALGFTYISLDLQGYRMGSMNATLNRVTAEVAGATVQINK
jgi:uncharacterized protein